MRKANRNCRAIRSFKVNKENNNKLNKSIFMASNTVMANYIRIFSILTLNTTTKKARLIIHTATNEEQGSCSKVTEEKEISAVRQFWKLHYELNYHSHHSNCIKSAQILK